MPREYIAFISYRHKSLDMRIAVRVHRMIEQFRVPRSLHASRKRLGMVFRDQDELPVTSDLSADIREALDHSEFLIVICTPDTPQSQWVCREIDYFLEHHDQQRVLTVLAAGEPQEAIPPALTRIVDENGEWVRDVEPLSADVRAESERAASRKLKREINRIFAAMLGCSFDALVMREQRRQRRRLAVGFSLALAVAIGFSALQMWNNARIREVNDQLEIRNRELSEEKAATQLRESRLLTINSVDALAAGDAQEAIRSAVEALPRDARDDRPYYAPAEQALVSALGVFDPNSPQYMITGTRLEQSTAIVDYALSADGARVATIDGYGVLHCFDSETGELAWEAQLESDAFYVNERDVRVFYIDDGDCIVALYGDAIAALSAKTGELLWRTDDGGSGTSFAFLSPDQSVLACVRYGFGADTLAFYSTSPTSSGERLFGVTLCENDERREYHTYSTYGVSRNGCFSEDGRRFFGAMYETETAEDGATVKNTRHYYAVDLQSRQLRILRSEEISEDERYGTCVGFVHSAELDSLFALYSGEDLYTAAVVERIDANSGEVLWRMETPELENCSFLGMDRNVQLAKGGSTLLFSRGPAIFLISQSTGDVLTCAAMSSDVVALYYIDSTFFGYILAEGSGEIAWVGANQTFVMGMDVLLGSADGAVVWNSGFLRGEVQDGTIQALYAECDPERTGYAIVRPEAGGSMLVVRRAKSINDPRQQLRVEGIPEGMTLHRLDDSRGALLAPDGTLYLRATIEAEGKEDSECILAVDPSARKVIRTIELDENYGDRCRLLPDGSGYVGESLDGELYLYDFASGERKTLCQAEWSVLREIEGGTIGEWMAEAESALLTDGGALLSVQCDGKELRIWRDGAEEDAAKLPEGCAWEYVRGVYRECMLEVGGNGRVLVSMYDSEQPSEAMRSFGLYDVGEGTWTIVDDVVHGDDERPVAMASIAPRFAVLDADGALRVYDAGEGSLLREIPIGLPANSVEDMQFICDDAYLLLYTGDRRVRIVEIETGELVYEEHFLSDNYDGVSACFDAEGHRLYLICEKGAMFNLGICLDARSWSKLFTVNGMLSYAPSTNEICAYAPLNFGALEKNLYVQEMLRTQELVEMGTGVL